MAATLTKMNQKTGPVSQRIEEIRQDLLSYDMPLSEAARRLALMEIEIDLLRRTMGLVPLDEMLIVDNRTNDDEVTPPP